MPLEQDLVSEFLMNEPQRLDDFSPFGEYQLPATPLGSRVNQMTQEDVQRTRLNNLLSIQDRDNAQYADEFAQHGGALNPLQRALKSMGENPEEMAQNALINTLGGGIGGGLTTSIAGGALSQARPGTLSALAWHGSRHKTDALRWNDEVRGTGQGAQTYGDGLYLGEAEGTGRAYMRAGQGSRLQYKGESLDKAKMDAATRGDGETANALHQLSMESDPQTALMNARSRGDSKAVELLESGEVASAPPGNLYKVDIDDDALETFLDWDKPLSEQSPAVQEFFGYKGKLNLKDINTDRIEFFENADGKYLDENGFSPNDYTDAGIPLNTQARLVDEYGDESWPISDLYIPNQPAKTGASLYQKMEEELGKQAASDALNKAGIKGIKFLDQQSRDSGTGTRNFVVFDDSIIKTLERNGEPIQELQRIEAARNRPQPGEEFQGNPFDDPPPADSVRLSNPLAAKINDRDIFEDIDSGLSDGVNSGELLVHARVKDGTKFNLGIDPSIGDFLSETEAVRESMDLFGEAKELTFFSDSMESAESWAKFFKKRNPDKKIELVFVRKDNENLQKSLGDGRVELPDGDVRSYEMSPIADHENPLLKGEPAGVETGDWYTTDTLDVVGVADIEI